MFIQIDKGKQWRSSNLHFSKLQAKAHSYVKHLAKQTNQSAILNKNFRTKILGRQKHTTRQRKNTYEFLVLGNHIDMTNLINKVLTTWNISPVNVKNYSIAYRYCCY